MIWAALRILLYASVAVLTLGVIAFVMLAAMLGGALHAIWEAAKKWAEIASAAISDFRVWIAEELHEIRVMWIAEQRVGASGPAKAEGLSHVSPSAAPYSGKVFGMSSRCAKGAVCDGGCEADCKSPDRGEAKKPPHPNTYAAARP